MAASHARHELVDALKLLLPKSWHIVPAKRNIDIPNRTTVIVKRMGLVKTPEAPRSNRTVRFVLTLVSRYSTDIEKAEDDIDVQLPILLDAVDRIRNLRWDSTEPVEVQDKYLGEDVIVYAPIKKEKL